MKIHDVWSRNYDQPCLVIDLRHKSLILPDSEYAMKMEVLLILSGIRNLVLIKIYSLVLCPNMARRSHYCMYYSVSSGSGVRHGPGGPGFSKAGPGLLPFLKI